MQVRFRLHVLVIVSALFSLTSQSQESKVSPSELGLFEPPVDHISEFERMNYWMQNKRNQQRLIDEGRLSFNRGANPLFEYPLDSILSDPGYHGISNYVDQNSGFPNSLLDYNCGARTYDTDSGYNHKGIDFFTWPFSWHKMDHDLVSVVAAAPGTITTKIDGNPDRSCTFNNSNWNAVYVTHADGSVTWYGHLKNGSLTSKTLGQTVVAGEFLGIVGSSGNSTGPHLHMETYDSMDNLIEPYSGACNSMNASSWWADQEPYYNSQIVKLATHASAPGFPSCPNTTDTPDFEDSFEGSDTVYFVRYYRDQLDSQMSSMVIRRPDNSVFSDWTHSPSGFGHYAASYWYNFFTLPANPQSGEWTFEVTFQGVTHTHSFYIDDVIFFGGFD